MEKSILNEKKQSRFKNLKKGINNDLLKDQKSKKSNLYNLAKSKNAPTIKIKEVKQEEDYSKKIQKLKTILENKNKPKLNRKKNDSRYKLIVSLFGIAIVINFYKIKAIGMVAGTLYLTKILLG